MPEPDPQWELRAFRLGAKVTWAMAVASLIYVVTTWSQPHRDWLSAITVAAALDGAVVWSLAGHWRAMQRYATRVMTAWNAAHVLAALALCAADGGSASPYVAVFFVSVGFAAVALPRTNVRALALLDSAALVVAGVLFGGSEPALVVLVAGIGATAGVCATIADERLGRIAALHDAKQEMVRRLARVVEYRDTDTGGHVERIGEYTALIAAGLGFDDDESRRLALAATMHDVGKVAVPDSILLKPGPLTTEERVVMQRHAEVGHEMLTGSGSDLLELAATIALTHHERVDGRGYPRALAGDAIPLAGRIVAVADVFDALTSDRVYKPAMGFDKSWRIILEGAGSQFDATVVAAFVAQRPAIVDVHDRRDTAGVALHGLRAA